ncbi:MAG: hsp70 family protein [Myxococcales bacterium]|nr:hsp70 family protein [Myxococcales bacterium]
MTTHPARYIVGIDLGTTHTVVAYADTRARAPEPGAAPAVEPFPIEQLVAPGQLAARPMLPSVRYHPADGEVADADRAGFAAADGTGAIFGEHALSLGARTPGRLVSSAKSWLSHGAVDRGAAILPWGSPRDVPKVSPVEASASYLRLLRDRWDRAHPDAPLAAQELMLTVPASFDEAARALTLQAARAAGLPRVRLVEEPQAAFYAWLAARAGDLEAALGSVRLALVVDVGGGTTDLTLIRVERRESGPRVTRVAVGDHLMLGGDNMDLALAKAAERSIASGAPLDVGRFAQLVQQCRAAKERLLGEAPPDRVPVTVLGSGSKLVGGARSTELSLQAVQELVVGGFFPPVDATSRPTRRGAGIVELGLPYVADPAITRHLVAFLSRHQELAREALGAHAPAPDALAVPDAVLFNGGVFRGARLRERTVEVLTGLRGGARPAVLENAAPDLAVAHGAVAYGLARRGLGLRIGGGSARSYHLLLGGQDSGRAVCLLPRGAEEGEEVALPDRTFSLRLGRPVRFHIASSTSEVRYVRPGELVDVDPERFTELPPIAAVLGDEGDARAELPVRLVSALTEIGTLEVSCVQADDPTRRYKLELRLRGAPDSADRAVGRVTQLHPRFDEAKERVGLVYGKSAQDVNSRDIKRLRADLEKLLGARERWTTPLLRELFAALLAGAKRRRRSADHERIWFNLAGYALRPGFGYPLDDWRIEQVVPIVRAGVQFLNEPQNWSEYWTFARRIAGGLPAKVQGTLLDTIAPELAPPERHKRRQKGPKKLGYDAMVRLAGSLEHPSAERKADVGGALLTRLCDHGDNPQGWWAIGRLGARVPFYGSAHHVVPAHVAAHWLERCLAVDFSAVEEAAFAAAQLARASGDRARDLDEATRAKVAARLEASGCPPAWAQMVREVTLLDEADERHVFGDSLPPGLRLVD